MSEEKEKLKERIRIAIVGVVGLLLLSSAFSGCITENQFVEKEEQSPQLVIERLDAEYLWDLSTIDESKVGLNNITVKNVGKGKFGSENNLKKVIYEIVINKQKWNVSGHTYAEPNGELYLGLDISELLRKSWINPSYYSGPFVLPVERYPGEYELEGTFYIKNESGETLDKENFSVLIPTANIGDTIVLHASPNFDLKLNSWHTEQNSDNKDGIDVILNITINNSYSRKKEYIPSGIKGIVMTKEGYVYGYRSSSNSLPFGELHPHQKISGEIRVSGIPNDYVPKEMKIWGVGYIDIEETIILR